MADINKRTKRELQEAYEDFLFKNVMAIYAANESAEIEKEAAELGEAKPEEAEKLFNKKERKENIKILLNFGKKAFLAVASVVFVAAISLYCAIVAFADVREVVAEALYHIITEDHGEYTSVSIGENTGFIDPEIYDWEGAYAPTYMPEGYKFTEKEKLSSVQMVVYEKDDLFIRFTQDTAITPAKIDTENADIVETIIIGESDGLFINEDGFTIICWSHNGTFLTVEGYESISELVAVAESIRSIK